MPCAYLSRDTRALQPERNGREARESSQRTCKNENSAVYRRRTASFRLCAGGMTGEGLGIKVTSWNAAEGSGKSGHRFCTVRVGLTCWDDELAIAADELVICKSEP